MLEEVYKWYSLNEEQIFFSAIVKDSFQIGLDTIKLKSSIKRLRNTLYFNVDFIKNYERIGLKADSILRNGKYYNEINFNYQDADIWTYSQWNDKYFWTKLKVKDLIINGDSASLRWYTEENRDFGYLVKTIKENGSWKISYLEGLDSKNAL